MAVMMIRISEAIISATISEWIPAPAPPTMLAMTEATPVPPTTDASVMPVSPR